MAYYNLANKNVAELCNHQRATPASHANAIAKMDEKIEVIKKELKEAKKANSSKADTLAKRLGKVGRELQALQAASAAYYVTVGSRVEPAPGLDYFAPAPSFPLCLNSLGNESSLLPSPHPPFKYIHVDTQMMADRRNKDETKNVSLGTSKINYNDPRVTVAWCKKHDVPIQRPFPKTLCAKFTWAMSIEPDYEF
eukprot:scaffold234439_cov29-Tisochrysis_lutea.AAC.2